MQSITKSPAYREAARLHYRARRQARIARRKGLRVVDADRAVSLTTAALTSIIDAWNALNAAEAVARAQAAGEAPETPQTPPEATDAASGEEAEAAVEPEIVVEDLTTGARLMDWTRQQVGQGRIAIVLFGGVKTGVEVRVERRPPTQDTTQDDNAATE